MKQHVGMEGGYINLTKVDPDYLDVLLNFLKVGEKISKCREPPVVSRRNRVDTHSYMEVPIIDDDMEVPKELLDEFNLAEEELDKYLRD